MNYVTVESCPVTWLGGGGSALLQLLVDRRRPTSLTKVSEVLWAGLVWKRFLW